VSYIPLLRDLHLSDSQGEHQNENLGRLVGERQLLEERYLAELVEGWIIFPYLDRKSRKCLELTFLSSSKYC
jgi:hypothetical protein